MTAADRDPLTIAREVLEREERLSAYSYSIPLAAQASWDATRSEQVKAAPDLARAVVAVADLADELSDAARGSYQECMDDAGDAYQAASNLIHAILNGETHD